MSLKVIKAYPPNYVALTKAFPYIKRRKGLLYAWVDRIYNPSGFHIPPPLLIHEAVHAVQQEELGVEKWWSEYIASPEFRFYEEALAHMAEWRTVRDNPALYPNADEILDQIVERLAGPLYGNMMGAKECREVLTGNRLVTAERVTSDAVDITTASIQ